MKEYRIKNKEKLKASRLENQWDKKRYERKKEEIRKQQAEYYTRQKESIMTQRKHYLKNNREKVLALQRKRYWSNTQLHLASSLRRRLRYFIGSGKRCSKLLGCDMKHIKKWFEFNFELDENFGFNWDNYGTVWEIDHVIPCKLFNMENENDIKKCFHWTNVSPLQKETNKEKSSNLVNHLILQNEVRVFLFKRLQCPVDKSLTNFYNAALTTAVNRKLLMQQQV